MRQEAEEIFSCRPPSSTPERSPDELLRSLAVHQIELELLNDELRRAAIVIENSRDRYLDLYDFAPIGYLTLNREGVIIEINLTCASLLGEERNKLINRRFVSRVMPEDNERWHRHFLRVKQSGKRQSCELQIKHGDGAVLIAKLESMPVNDGGVPSVRIILSDITERIKLAKEAIEQRNEMAKLHTLHVAAQTAACIAHEMNQPLLAIASYSRAALMLLNADKPELKKIHKAIDGCEHQSLRAGHTLRELLDSLNSATFPAQALNLGKEIRTVLSVAKTEHELEFDPVFRSDEKLPLVRVNRTHLHKVMLNLLHNAVEAMTESKVALPAITVIVRSKPDEGVAQVTIRDNGPGIETEDLPRLFDPFFTTKDKGIGMGLAVSRSLIEECGGKLWADPRDCDQLWIDPQERPGATFHLTLPFAS